MIKNLEQPTTAVVFENDGEETARYASAKTEGNLSLTQIWQYVTRTRSLPADLDLDKFFKVVHERLRSPEWEVRQHSLRVLRDFIPIVDTKTAEEKLKTVLEDLIINLGHVGPAVRKAAVDCLRTYLKYSNNSDGILQDLVVNGVEKANTNNVNPNVVLGIILSIPFLVLPKISDKTLSYVLNELLNKATQAIHQETSLRSLMRIKYIIGEQQFNKLLEDGETQDAHETFDALCELYNLHAQYMQEMNANNETRILWNDFNQNVIEDATASWVSNVEIKQNCGDDLEFELVEDKVILETEIQLKSGSALTMQIHEESRQSSFTEATDSEEDGRHGTGLVKVLTDESEQDEYELHRRTPRRVRFGGEIVKMRTPDSDGNLTNEECDADNRPTASADKASKRNSRSLIPIPVRSSSLPNSPSRSAKTKVQYCSSPNLSCKQHIFGPKVNTSRIPRRRGTFQSTIKITINEAVVDTSEDMKNSEKKPEENSTSSRKSRSPIRSKRGKLTEETKTQSPSQLNPIPVHNEIEILHNLTRSPDRQKSQTRGETLQQTSSTVELNTNLLKQDTHLENTQQMKLTEKAKTERLQREINVDQNAFRETYSSFKVCSPDLNKQPGDVRTSLPAIPPGAKNSKNDKKENTHIVLNNEIIQDLQCKDNTRSRLRGMENVLKMMKTRDVPLESITAQLPEFLTILFSAHFQPILRLPAQEIMAHLITNSNASVLQDNIPSIASSLSKIGAPDGVRLAILLLKRIDPSILVDELLNKGIIQAKSSKTREGCLQILMMICRMAPSTDINVCKTTKGVVEVMSDRKRRVRQAALELLASLAQVGSPGFVLDVVTNTTTNNSEKDKLLKALRTRLSRKQLPSVEVSGHVRYSTPTAEAELEWLALGSATVFPGSRKEDSCGNRVRSSNARINVVSEEPNQDEKVNYWQRNIRHRGSASVTEIHRSSGSDWSKDSNEDGTNNQTSTQIWAIDPSTFQTTKPLNNKGPLRPIFVLQPTASSTSSNSSVYKLKEINLENFSKGRGRSFSPPKKKFVDSSDSGDSFERNPSRLDGHRTYGKESFRKSFSSDNLNGGGRVLLQPSSMSSGCSSTSTSASGRSGNWNKELKSGIPIPIGSDSRIKFKRRHRDSNRGLLLSDDYSRSKTSSDSPDKSSAPSKAILATEPFSSGSESSGYFTPPAEHHLPETTYNYHETNHQQKTPERFIQIATPKKEPESFRMVESESLQQSGNCESMKQVEEDPVVEDITESSFIVQDDSDSEHKRTIERENTANSLDEIDFTEKRPFTEDRALSKSETDLKNPPEVRRKSLKSAPPLNDPSTPGIPVYHTFNETKINITNTSLPGSVDVVVQSEVKTVEIEPSNLEVTEKRVLKRTMSKSLPKKSARTYLNESMPFSDNLQSFSKPKDGFNETMALLESNDWEATMKGLKGLVRLKRYHPEILEQHMHNVCVLLGKHIKNLRSQVARAACSAASEMFVEHKRSLEMEVEELAAPLLQRTADTNKFLRSDANSALDAMCVALPAPKVVALIAGRGCTHQNAVVRATSARLLCNLVHRLGDDKVFQLPRETRDKILLAGANMLMDGNLDARKNSKMMLSMLCSHPQFQKAMLEAVPTCTMRHIQKTLKTLK